MIKLISIRYFISFFLGILVGIKYIAIVFSTSEDIKSSIVSTSSILFKYLGAFSTIIKDVVDANALDLINYGTLGSITLLVVSLSSYLLLQSLVAYGLLKADNWARFAAVILSGSRVVINLGNNVAASFTAKTYYVIIGLAILVAGTILAMYTINSLKNKRHFIFLSITSYSLMIIGIIISDYNTNTILTNLAERLALVLAISIAYYLTFNRNVEEFFLSKYFKKFSSR